MVFFVPPLVPFACFTLFCLYVSFLVQHSVVCCASWTCNFPPRWKAQLLTECTICPLSQFPETCSSSSAVLSWEHSNGNQLLAHPCLFAALLRLQGSLDPPLSPAGQKTLTAPNKQWLVTIRRVFKELYLHVKRHGDIYVYQMAQSRWIW